MNRKKSISTAYRRTTPPKLLTTARNVLAAMEKNPAFTTGPLPPSVPTRDLLDAGITRFRGCYEAALNHDYAKIRERDAEEQVLIKLLDAIRSYLELEGVNNQEVFFDTGFEPPVAPRNTASNVQQSSYALSVYHGPQSGTVLGKAPRVKHAGSYEIHVTEGDPLVEEEWYHKGVFLGSSGMLMNGFVLGRRYCFRHRPIFSSGPGAWSPVVSLIVV